MPHELYEFKKSFSCTPPKNTPDFEIKFTISVAGVSQNRKRQLDCLRLVYSCNCRAESKAVLKASTRLYIDDLFATIIGKVSSQKRFNSLEEINASRLLRNSIFILTRNSCISRLRT